VSGPRLLRLAVGRLDLRLLAVGRLDLRLLPVGLLGLRLPVGLLGVRLLGVGLLAGVGRRLLDLVDRLLHRVGRR
jgi:hypothetical protein